MAFDSSMKDATGGAADPDVTIDVVANTARHLARTPLVVEVTRRHRYRQLYHRRGT